MNLHLGGIRGASTTGGALGEHRGYRGLVAFVAGAFLLLAGRLWQLQVLEGERHYRRSTDNFVKENSLPAPRGQILDARGRVLADNRPSYDVQVTPALLTPAALARLARHLQLDGDALAQLRARLAAKKGSERQQPLVVAEDIARDQLGAIAGDEAELPGVTVLPLARRVYPHGPALAHALGYMNQVGPDELGALREQGYRSGDSLGRAGLERQFEPYLRGKDGFERVIVDAKRRVKNDFEARELEALVGGPLRREPVPGDNVVLTVDLDFQRSVEKALARHHSAAAVVVDVDTGRVLALASHPAFDPNVLTGHLPYAEAERLERDPFHPLVDKAIREDYFPASTFKIVPALAGLGDRLISPDEKVRCYGAYKLPGHTFRCMKDHGPMNLYGALVESCNVYFYHLGERVGMDRMARVAAELGFGAPAGIGLAGEAPGFVPTQDWYKTQGGFRIGYALNTAIGQGSTKVTLLQTALAYAAVANGGRLYVPELADRIETPSGQRVQTFAPVLRRKLDVAPEHLALLRRALCGVVNDLRGTANSALDPTLPVAVCGKSGTAQVRKSKKGEAAGWDLGNDHAWFAGFAPADRPRIAFAVLIEHGGLGGHVAGPTAMAIVRGWLRAQETATAAAATQHDDAATRAGGSATAAAAPGRSHPLANDAATRAGGSATAAAAPGRSHPLASSRDGPDKLGAPVGAGLSLSGPSPGSSSGEGR